ncbi:DUF2079 domain-containing protein [Aeromicrobium sp.]|uniref:DUF2079 domain-containing protein n=1 Tax=Aeromicrobium sp. TaxID=1871063 RepID=UPI003D6BF01D
MGAKRARAFAAAWAVLCGAGYVTVSLVRFDRFEPASYDNAIFEQAIRGYAQLNAPIVAIKGPGFNLLGDHFSPVIALVAPMYRLFPSAQTLLVVQAVLIAVSVYVVASLGLRRLGVWAGGGIALAYGLSFGLQSAVTADFHEVAFGVPLLALAGAAYVEGHYGRVVAWSLPLLLVKEDLGLTVALIGLVLWLAGERRRGTGLALAGGAGFLLVILVIIPSLNPDGVYAYTGSVGGDRGLLETVLDEPGRKLLTVVMTFAVTGFAALASPWALLVLPTFAWRFAGDNPYYWGTDFHYSILLMTIVAVAAIDAIGRHPRLRLAAIGAVVFTAAMQVTSPLATLVDPDTYERPARAEAAERVIGLLPDGSTVDTDIGLMTHLTTDHVVTWIGTPRNATPDWVLLDHGSGIGSPPDAVAYAEDRYGVPFTLVEEVDGYQLARRQ